MNKKQANDPLVQENRVLSVRVRLAQAFMGMWQVAYDALLNHGINYRTLPAYKEVTPLDAALENGVTLEQGEANILKYIERVISDIRAAIRRKAFRRLDS